MTDREMSFDDQLEKARAEAYIYRNEYRKQKREVARLIEALTAARECDTTETEEGYPMCVLCGSVDEEDAGHIEHGEGCPYVALTSQEALKNGEGLKPKHGICTCTGVRGYTGIRCDKCGNLMPQIQI